MNLSGHIRQLCDDFFAAATENNEVYFVKWTFPDGRLPDLSLSKAEADSALARRTLRTIEEWLPACASHEDEIVLKVLRYYCGYILKNEQNYFLKFDLNHYTCPIPTFLGKLLEMPLDTPDRRAVYLETLSRFPAFIDQMADKLPEQSARYIRMPVEGCRLVQQSLASCRAMAGRLGRTPGAEPLARDIERSLDRLMEYIGGEYAAHAPQTIGMGQYPGGLEMYSRQVETYISCTPAPEEIQRRGYEALRETEGEMLSIARSLGFFGTLKAFSDSVQRDPRFRYHSPEEMQQKMTGYLDAIRPLMPRYFSRMPRADCRVARISPELEATTSWGYYNVPVEKNEGVYYYSAAELDKRCQVRAGAVVYHELLPGHHYQMSLALEDDTLPNLLRHHYNTAFADGWAEYASGFCRELGLYTPYADFGRLSWDAFLCCRLIVDTGLNALGWTYERAEGFLREHTMLTHSEIHTELLRYTIGMPAQALSYKWGSLQFFDMRRRAQQALGPRFDLKAFHDALLAFGSIPLDITEQHFQWYLNHEKAGDGA